jgi:hypothetical protein
MDIITVAVAILVAIGLEETSNSTSSEEDGGVRMSGCYDQDGKPIPEGDRRLDPPPVY